MNKNPQNYVSPIRKKKFIYTTFIEEGKKSKGKIRQ